MSARERERGELPPPIWPLSGLARAGASCFLQQILLLPALNLAQIFNQLENSSPFWKVVFHSGMYAGGLVSLNVISMRQIQNLPVSLRLVLFACFVASCVAVVYGFIDDYRQIRRMRNRTDSDAA